MSHVEKVFPHVRDAAVEDAAKELIDSLARSTRQARAVVMLMRDGIAEPITAAAMLRRVSDRKHSVVMG